MAAKLGLAELTHENFKPYTGHVLLFEWLPAGREHETLRFEVVDVRANERFAESCRAGQPGSVYKRVPFSVLFRAVQEPPFLQGLLKLKHDAFEECELLLTRVLAPGRDPSQAWFEAVFG
jgi:hypothetical protein